jgi:hypothetical protein
MKANCRGAAPLILIYVVAALGLTQLVPNWRVGNLFAKGPATKELRAAQEAAAKAKLEAEEAKSKYEKALIDERTKTVQQSQYSQQMVHGIPIALARAPQTPEVVFATGLAKRASTGLAAAIGELPPDKQSEISFLVEQALSAKQAEVDAALAALAAKDKELAVTTAEKKVIEAKFPVLEQQAKAAEIKAVAAERWSSLKTNEVAVYAEKAAEKEAENGSLGHLVQKLFWAIGFLAALYIFRPLHLAVTRAGVPGRAASRWSQQGGEKHFQFTPLTRTPRSSDERYPTR